MADRGMTAAVLTEVAKSSNQPIHLAQVLFSTTSVYITDAWTDIVWNGNTYTALGHLIAFSNIKESVDLEVTTLTVQLSGVDQTMIAAILAEYYIDRELRIYTAFLDSDNAVIVDPVLLFDGRMDAPVVEENPDDGTCVVSVQASNIWMNFDRKAGRHTNHEEEQLWFPGDKGFEFASETTGEIVWGRK